MKAPWTEQQCERLNEIQQADNSFHPMTCGKCRAVLVATPDGWKCQTVGCDYAQDWCHGNPPGT